VLASAAIPGVLPPVEWQGRLLVDGGVLNNTPIAHALELGAREVYVLPTGGPCALNEAPRGALGMVVQAMSLMVAHRFAGEAAAFAGRAKLTILPPPCPIEIQPMDFGHAEELISRAYGCARFPRTSARPVSSRFRGGRLWRGPDESLREFVKSAPQGRARRPGHVRNRTAPGIVGGARLRPSCRRGRF
jgi:predicted acylesterase/phospholipase RssA